MKTVAAMFAVAILAIGTAVLADSQATSAPARKKLLFLTHAGLYKHTSLGPAEKAVIEIGKTGDFDVTTVEGYKQEAAKLDFAFLTAEYLSRGANSDLDRPRPPSLDRAAE